MYMMWLNHKTFRSVGRLSDTSNIHNTPASRKSGYDVLIRYSKLSLMSIVRSNTKISNSADYYTESKDSEDS